MEYKILWSFFIILENTIYLKLDIQVIINQYIYKEIIENKEFTNTNNQSK